MKYSGAEMPVPPRLCTRLTRAGDQEVEHEREAEREDEEAPVAKRAQQLVADVRQADHRCARSAGDA